jgi:hypothetical protein
MPRYNRSEVTIIKPKNIGNACPAMLLFYNLQKITIAKAVTFFKNILSHIITGYYIQWS